MIETDPTAGEPSHPLHRPTPLEILLDDAPCLVVNKPSRLLIQGHPGISDTMVLRVKAYLREKYQKTGNVYLGVPHRLDRAVSGVLLFSRNSKGATRLAQQFEHRQVEKVYWAIIPEEPDPPEGRLVHVIEKVPDRAMARAAEAGAKGAKEAILDYRLLGRVSSGWLLELRPRTGRYHQIRIQLSLRGWPIIGDGDYGSEIPFGVGIPWESADLRDNRDGPIALHGRRLTFLHPVRYEPVSATAPVPSYWPAETESFAQMDCGSR
ncbi:tRNA pseudouridine synthase C [Planctomycetes bacterium Pan216]|uniref:tRNA pseudouridine synthase C n=1 Tax=Kolteria novifilia TaxID=2527975 RepID=A0A518BBM7_9BACT|nr:tRNA pseudouridine synthase C [Planctomycetes bacterium Pan216]